MVQKYFNLQLKKVYDLCSNVADTEMIQHVFCFLSVAWNFLKCEKYLCSVV